MVGQAGRHRLAAPRRVGARTQAHKWAHVLGLRGGLDVLRAGHCAQEWAEGWICRCLRSTSKGHLWLSTAVRYDSWIRSIAQARVRRHCRVSRRTRQSPGASHRRKRAPVFAPFSQGIWRVSQGKRRPGWGRERGLRSIALICGSPRALTAVPARLVTEGRPVVGRDC